MPPFLLLAPPVRYVPYANERYGFIVDRPTFLVPQRPPDNGDGREFRAGRIEMRVYAGWNVDGATARTLLAAHAKGHRPAYALQKGDGFAVSWSEKGTIHYERTFVSRTKLTTVEFDYPASERARMDAVVVRVARSLRP